MRVSGLSEQSLGPFWVWARASERVSECVLVYVLKVAGNWDCCACEYINALAICGGISAISLWSHLLRARVCFDFFFFFFDVFFLLILILLLLWLLFALYERTCSVRCTSCCFTLSLYYLLKSLHTVFFLLLFPLLCCAQNAPSLTSLLSFIAFGIYRAAVCFFFRNH